ncbi:MAG: sugar phosphate isomerase/epimerase [Clostridia bacterium]|nr:sugar phosphate isomerase/epimerase [Clostridia bacterium]
MDICTQTRHLANTMGILKAVDLLADAGYTALDISFTSAPSFHRQDNYSLVVDELIRRREAYGIKYIQAHAPFHWSINTLFDELVPEYPRVFEIAGRLGVESIVVHPIQNAEVERYRTNGERLFERNIEFYNALKPLARANGLKIAIENIWKYHPHNGRIIDDTCASPEEMLRFIDVLNDPEVFTLCVDIGHITLTDREPDNFIRAIGKGKIGCLHIHDNDYKEDQHNLPGAGRINWGSVCQALAEVDYQGAITLEADRFFYNYPEEYYPTVARFMADTARMLRDKVELYRV